MAFERTLIVRFPDVDYARVVYYPRFFDYTHQVFEDFFALEVKCPYVVMLEQRRLGYPSVHVEADFKAPLRFGEEFRVVMEVTKLTDGSATCRYRFFSVSQPSSIRPNATLTVVVASISLDTFTPAPMPADVRTAFERHLVPGS